MGERMRLEALEQALKNRMDQLRDEMDKVDAELCQVESRLDELDIEERR